MVRVPIGETVKVDLWNPEKNHGLIKYFTNTMNLVRAESEFPLNKDDLALVIESHDGFVKVLPKDKFSDVIRGSKLDKIDVKGLISLILFFLKQQVHETGGILSLDELFSLFKGTSLKNIISKKHLMKSITSTDSSFDHVEEDGIQYAVLKPIECPRDESMILNLARTHPYLTINFIQRETKWSTIRITRMVRYFLETNRCRKDTSYKEGDRYFFLI